jgi:hypothetical protein
VRQSYKDQIASEKKQYTQDLKKAKGLAKKQGDRAALRFLGTLAKTGGDAVVAATNTVANPFKTAAHRIKRMAQGVTTAVMAADDQITAALMSGVKAVAHGGAAATVKPAVAGAKAAAASYRNRQGQQPGSGSVAG